MTKKTALALLLLGLHCSGAHLSQETEAAFGEYIANLEPRIVKQHASAETHLAMLNLEAGQRAALELQLMSGDVRIEPVNGAMRELTGALLHHWRAAAFVADATPEEMLALLRGHSHLSGYYTPKVAESRVLKDDGETVTLAVRLREQRIRTVVLDAEYKVESRLLSRDRGYSFSRSTHIWQIDNPGTPHERRRAAGDDDGFLWRLNSYWSFTRKGGGLLIECEAVSLTRDIPMGLGWLITPIVHNLPSEALEFTLKATRSALLALAAGKEQR